MTSEDLLAASNLPPGDLKSPPSDLIAPVPLPSSSALPTFRSTAPLTPVVCDERAIGRLLEVLISRSGLPVAEVARRLGITTNGIRQYLHGRRTKPSLLWFLRLAELCGAKVSIEFPPRGVR